MELAQGFAATSVEEICREAKLTKGSLFHYFDSKEKLGQELLRRRCAEAGNPLTPTGRLHADPLQRIFAAVDEAARVWSTGGGCLVGTFAQELSDTHPAIRSLCREAFDHWAKTMQRDLDAAKARYAPAARIDTGELADHFIAVVEGAVILARARGDRRVVAVSLRHFKRYVAQLFNVRTP